MKYESQTRGGKEKALRVTAKELVPVASVPDSVARLRAGLGATITAGVESMVACLVSDVSAAVTVGVAKAMVDVEADVFGLCLEAQGGDSGAGASS